MKTEGFNVILNDTQTSDSSKHRCINSIRIGNEYYKEGPVFIPKDTPITIERLMKSVSIGKSASDYRGMDYSDVKKELENKGFNKIILKRSDDLIIGFISKEGTVKNISINGVDKFNNNDAFYIDDTIEIVVNTFKDSGCEDITLKAN